MGDFRGHYWICQDNADVEPKIIHENIANNLAFSSASWLAALRSGHFEEGGSKELMPGPSGQDELSLLQDEDFSRNLGFVKFCLSKKLGKRKACCAKNWAPLIQICKKEMDWSRDWLMVWWLHVFTLNLFREYILCEFWRQHEIGSRLVKTWWKY